MTRSFPVFAAAAILTAAVAAHPAAAQPFALRPGFSTDSTKAVTEAVVPTADLDARSYAGALALMTRIEAAADAVCAGAASDTRPDQKADYRECRRQAVTGAVARMRSPALTQLTARRGRLP